MSTSTQISENQREKSRKTDHSELDYISNLPDCLLSDILSRLSTEDAVRTSVLSKDWKYKWTTIYDFYLYYNHWWKNSVNTFRNFVDRTLLLAKNIQSFRLHFKGNHNFGPDFERWLCVALSREVHCLDIWYEGSGMVWPTNLVHFSSFRELRLDIPCTLRVSAKVCFPHLTTLKLGRVEILNELTTSDRVEFSFSVLETLELRQCKWLNVKFVEIYAPKLTTYHSTAKYGSASLSEYTINIVGDKLVNFECDGGLSENIVLFGGSKVVYAALRNGFLNYDSDGVKKETGFRIRKLLNGFSGVKRLQLSESISEAIALSKLTGLSLPKYYEMEQLDMSFLSNGQVVLELLHAVPCLKILNITANTGWIDYDYDAEELVPLCLVSHLEKVTLSRFPRKMYEMRLAKFFCKYAVNLKSLQVSFTTVAKELLTYPKASTCLTIVFRKYTPYPGENEKFNVVDSC